MPTSHETIRVNVADSAGTIILNRPEQHNALTSEMVAELSERLDDFYYEKRVRAIVLTGAGEWFSQGLDLEESQLEADSAGDAQLNYARWGEEATALRDLLLRMLEIPKPIIASVNGPAHSAGAALVAAADIVVASESATFGLPDTRSGLVAGLAASLVSFRLGAGQAARLALTSTPIAAAEAHRLGLFHEVVPAENTWVRATQLVQECAAGAPEAVQLTKQLINETLGEHLATQLSSAAALSATARTTEAAAEGIAAQLASRPPNWL